MDFLSSALWQMADYQRMQPCLWISSDPLLSVLPDSRSHSLSQQHLSSLHVHIPSQNDPLHHVHCQLEVEFHDQIHILHQQVSPQPHHAHALQRHCHRCTDQQHLRHPLLQSQCQLHYPCQYIQLPLLPLRLRFPLVPWTLKSSLLLYWFHPVQ